MKANFKINKTKVNDVNKDKKKSENLTREEFEEYMLRSGSKGSFMVYRSEKKDDELGLQEL
jgi:hypothetical protein